jgi:hypothetical protein
VIALTYAIETAGSRRSGGGHGVCVFLCAACLLLLVSRLWDVGCGFDCTLLVPNYVPRSLSFVGARDICNFFTYARN